MAAINKRRVLLGALAGGVVWTIWSMLVNMLFLAERYEGAQEAGLLLKEPRYHFLFDWIVTLFILSYIVSLLYASVRGVWGAGPGTALLVGVMVGFAAGFPSNLATASWSPLDRILPFWWMIDSWAGAALASVVAGFFYKD